MRTVSSLTRGLTAMSAVATGLIVGALGWASVSAQPKTVAGPAADPSDTSPEVAPDPTALTSSGAVEDPTPTVVTSPPRPSATTAGPTAGPSTTARPRPTTTKPITPPKTTPAPGRGGSHASSGAS